MRVVADEFEVFVFEIGDVANCRIQFHPGQRPRFARELQPGLLEVIAVQVQVAERVDERAGPQIADLGDHHREQRVRSDVEGNAQEQIRAALIKLATQFPVLDEKLEQRVARRQSHLVEFADVPGADDEPAACWIVPDLLDDLLNLVNRAAIRCSPIAPLSPVDPAEVALFVGPFIPNRDPVLVQVFDIGIAAQEP